MLEHLGKETIDRANSVANRLGDWSSELYALQFVMAGKSVPKRLPDKWVKVPVADDRSGPVPWLKVEPNLGSAARAARTLQIIAEGISRCPGDGQWVTAAKHLLSSKHSTVLALQDSIGAVATAKLMHDLVAIVKCDLVGGVLPAIF